MVKKKQRENAPADVPRFAKAAASSKRPTRRQAGAAAAGDLKALARCLLNGGARSTPASAFALKPPASRQCDGDDAAKLPPPAQSAPLLAHGSGEPVRRAEPDGRERVAADSAASPAALARVVSSAEAAAAAVGRERKKKRKARKKLKSNNVKDGKLGLPERGDDWPSASVDAAATAAALDEAAADAASATGGVATEGGEHGDVDDGKDDLGTANQRHYESASPNATSAASPAVAQLADALRSGFWVRDGATIRIDSIGDGFQSRSSSGGSETLLSIYETAFPLVLQGCCRLRLVGGRALRVHGFKLRPGSAFFDVYSPSLYPHLALSLDEETAAADRCLDGSSATAALEEAQPSEAPPAAATPRRWVTLALRQLQSAEALLRVGSGGAYRRLLDLPALRADCPGLLASGGGMRLLAAATPESNGLLEPAVSLQESLDQLEATATLPIVLVCGGKNAGKSTLTRHIANSLLNRYDSVFYLDVDPGQTEFTLPGCVALKKVTAPLFGPPWTHVGDVDISVRFLGCTSPHADPDHYLQCVLSLVEEYEAHRQQGAPLVVNTMGWVQNLGLSLLVDTLRLVKPSLVVQISSASSANKNLPPLVPDLLACNEWSVQQGQAEAKDEKLNFICCHLWSPDPGASTAATAVDESFASEGWPAKNTGALGAPQCRDLMTFAYFGPLWTSSSSSFEPRASDPQSFINAAPPYAVPWDAVAVQLCGGASVPAHLVLGALNASVVVLASVEQSEGRDTSSAIKMIDPHVPTSYVGFGLVRAIDVDRRLFYITTPVCPKRLRTVNCLRKGTGVELPAAILTKQGCLAGQPLPYVDVHRQGVGTRSSQATPRNYCAFGRNRR